MAAGTSNVHHVAFAERQRRLASDLARERLRALCGRLDPEREARAVGARLADSGPGLTGARGVEPRRDRERVRCVDHRARRRRRLTGGRDAQCRPVDPACPAGATVQEQRVPVPAGVADRAAVAFVEPPQRGRAGRDLGSGAARRSPGRIEAWIKDLFSRDTRPTGIEDAAPVVGDDARARPRSEQSSVNTAADSPWVCISCLSSAYCWPQKRRHRRHRPGQRRRPDARQRPRASACPAGGNGSTPPYSPITEACRSAGSANGPKYRWRVANVARGRGHGVAAVGAAAVAVDERRRVEPLDLAA